MIEVQPVRQDIVPYKKADAADDDEQNNYEIDKRVGDIIAEGMIGTKLPHEVKAGIAESGNRMKDPSPDAFADAHAGNKAVGKNERSDDFHNDHGAQNKAGKPENAAVFRDGDGLLHDNALL